MDSEHASCVAALERSAIQKAVERHAPRYGITKAYLFGSYARNEADGESDVDVLIEYEPGFTLFSLGGFSADLEGDLGVPVDVVCREKYLRPRVLTSYLKDRVLLYEK